MCHRISSHLMFIMCGCICALLVILVGMHFVGHTRERAAERKILAMGGTVSRGFNWNDRSIGNSVLPSCVIALVGEDHLLDIDYIMLWGTNASDDDLPGVLDMFPDINGINLGMTRVSDRSIDILVKHQRLREIILVDTRVSEEGIQQLRRKMPRARILSRSDFE